jgi:hypothetical protein
MFGLAFSANPLGQVQVVLLKDGAGANCCLETVVVLASTNPFLQGIMHFTRTVIVEFMTTATM